VESEVDGRETGEEVKMKRLLGLILLAILLINLSNVLFIYLYQLIYSSHLLGTYSYWYRIIEPIHWFLVVIAVPWLGLLPLVIHLLKMYSFREKRRLRFGLVHLTACLLFSAAQIAIHMLYEPDQGWYHHDAIYRFVAGILFYSEYNLVFYVCTVAAYYAITYFRQLRLKEINEARLAESLANAQLSSLKMKLQPHFIFNALQSVNVLVLDKQIEPASEMLEKLSVLLRQSIDMEDRQLVTLERELETVQRYLEVEKIRFGERLVVETDIDPAVMNALVPGLILQPVIENAVKHGIANKMSPGKIILVVRRTGSELSIVVSNDGPSLPEDWSFERHSGFGLKTTRRRLELLFGDRFSFRVGNAPGGGVSLEINLPFEEQLLSVDEERLN
jgi:two-component system LytT family sensor kinase